MYIKVRVIAGAKKESLEKKTKDTYYISVKEKAERNMANRRVCEMMAIVLKVPVKSIRIISGHQSPSKILSVVIPENLV